MPNDEDWARLAAALEARIAELHLTQADIQKRGGPSPATLRSIINGRTSALSASKRRDLERALRWHAGSIDSVLVGGNPEVIAAGSLGRGLASLIPASEPLPFQEHWDRAERLLSYSREVARAGDILGAVNGLEGLQSTAELLVRLLPGEDESGGVVERSSSDDAELDPRTALRGHAGRLRNEVEDTDDGAQQSG